MKITLSLRKMYQHDNNMTFDFSNNICSWKSTQRSTVGEAHRLPYVLLLNNFREIGLSIFMMHP